MQKWILFLFPLGLHNQAYRVVSITGQLVYRYRDSFHVLLESKLSSAQFSLGESFLVQAWRDTVPGTYVWYFETCHDKICLIWLYLFTRP